MSADAYIAAAVLLANAGLLGGVVYSGAFGGGFEAYTPSDVVPLREQVLSAEGGAATAAAPTADPDRPAGPADGGAALPAGPPPGDLDPNKHLPLAGMEGFVGLQQDACWKLEGFLLNMGDALSAAGAEAPLDQPSIQSLTKETACTLADAPVREAIGRYAERYEAAGLAPLAPFSLLSADYPSDPQSLFSAEAPAPGDPGQAGAAAGQPGQPGQGQPGQGQPGQAGVVQGESGQGSPSTEMLIAGVPGFSGDACDALRRFLDHMDAELTGAGVASPLSTEARGGLLGGSCSVEEAAVREGLLAYRRAWNQAGLRPLRPFAHLDGAPQ